jgi:hypothetical protein
VRRLLVLLLTCAAVLGAAVPASAAESSLDRGRREVSQARALLTQALETFKAGDPEQAYPLARTAKLDHFE